MIVRSVCIALAAVTAVLVVATPAGATSGVLQVDQPYIAITTALAWLVPTGLGLLACGAVPPKYIGSVIRTGWLALGISVVGYWLFGFAFEFGGLGFASDQPDLAGLAQEWTWLPLSVMWGSKWGVLGLEGYMLRGAASTPTALALFFAQLPWITTAVAVPLWSLQGRIRAFGLFLCGLLVAFIYTLVGNWTWGGGWLANLGANLGLGHGFVDFGGAGVVHLTGSMIAFSGMLALGVRAYAQPAAKQLSLPTLANERGGTDLRWSSLDEPYVPMPPLYLPALATLGAWLTVIGWAGWSLSTPAHMIGMQLDWVRVLVALILAAAGGALVTVAFCWFTTGEGDALMTARGVVSAMVAGSAVLPFVPLWTALVVGAGAGLLVPLVQYAVEHLFRLDDPTSAVATHGVAAVWGLLSLGIFADGEAGQGWNRFGLDAYLGVEGQGVTGYLAAPGYVSDWPGQMQAQATGAVAIALATFFLSWLLFAVFQGLSRAWNGEYAVRLPKGQPLRRTITQNPKGRRSKAPVLGDEEQTQLGQRADPPVQGSSPQEAAPDLGMSWWHRLVDRMRSDQVGHGEASTTLKATTAAETGRNAVAEEGE